MLQDPAVGWTSGSRFYEPNTAVRAPAHPAAVTRRREEGGVCHSLISTGPRTTPCVAPDTPTPAHVHSAHAALCCLERLSAHSQPALRTGLMAPAWRPALCIWGAFLTSWPEYMEQAPSRGHEASPQSGLEEGYNLCSSSKEFRGLSVRAQARRVRISFSFPVAGVSPLLSPPRSAMRRSA